MKDKYLIIGTGKISNQLSTILFDHNQKPAVIALSKLDSGMYDDVNQYFTIVYAGYDHFSLCQNISKLKSLIKQLEGRKYQGNFVFLNTQGILSNHIIQDFSNTLSHKFTFYRVFVNFLSYIVPKLDYLQKQLSLLNF